MPLPIWAMIRRRSDVRAPRLACKSPRYCLDVQRMAHARSFNLRQPRYPRTILPFVHGHRIDDVGLHRQLAQSEAPAQLRDCSHARHGARGAAPQPSHRRPDRSRRPLAAAIRRGHLRLRSALNRILLWRALFQSKPPDSRFAPASTGHGTGQFPRPRDAPNSPIPHLPAENTELSGG